VTSPIVRDGSAARSIEHMSVITWSVVAFMSEPLDSRSPCSEGSFAGTEEGGMERRSGAVALDGELDRG
jgi:hypothetical protein